MKRVWLATDARGGRHMTESDLTASQWFRSETFDVEEIAETDFEAQGVRAAHSGKSQIDNPYNPRKPGESYPVHAALAWNAGFHSIANPGILDD